MAAALKVVGRGGGGVNEMQTVLDDTRVLWGLTRFTFGEGTFRRDKLIFVHFNGEKCSAMKRARANNEKGNVLQTLKGSHGDIEITSVDECSVEHIVGTLQKVFVTDKGEFSIGALKEDYEARIKEAMEQKGAAGEEEDEPPPPKRPTAAEMDVPSEKVLEAIRKPTGPFNWALFRTPPAQPPTLFDAGSLSLPEMQEKIPDNEVLYGILRMGFGAGQFRRTKWVFVHWVGPSTPIVKKGRATACREEFQTLLQPFSSAVELGAKEELGLQEFVDRMKRVFVVDEQRGAKAKREEGFGLDDFLEALKEEQAANAEFFHDEVPEGGAAAPVEHGLEETLQLLSKADSPVNWAVFA